MRTFAMLSHIIVLLLGIPLMYFAANFYLGTAEDLAHMIRDDGLSFFAGRMLINLIMIGLLQGAYYGINVVVSLILERKVIRIGSVTDLLAVQFLVFFTVSLGAVSAFFLQEFL